MSWRENLYRRAADAAAPRPTLERTIEQSREQADASPYLEAFRSKGTDVLLLFSPADDIVMKMLLDFKGIKLVNAEDAKLEASTEARTAALRFTDASLRDSSQRKRE